MTTQERYEYCRARAAIARTPAERATWLERAAKEQYGTIYDPKKAVPSSWGKYR